MTAVRLGRVCTRPRARIHLALDGKTCDAARGARIGYEVTRPDLVAPGNPCRRCFTPARVERAYGALYTATGTGAARIRSLLADVVDGMRTPEQVAADRELAERIKATMAAAGSIRILPPAERAAAWDAARRDYDLAHQTTAA